MFTSTIIAIALGLTPAHTGNRQDVVTGNYDTAVGRYQQTIDRKGRVNVRGFDRRNGELYELTIDASGSVSGTVGNQEISFRAAPFS